MWHGATLAWGMELDLYIRHGNNPPRGQCESGNRETARVGTLGNGSCTFLLILQHRLSRNYDFLLAMHFMCPVLLFPSFSVWRHSLSSVLSFVGAFFPFKVLSSSSKGKREARQHVWKVVHFCLVRWFGQSQLVSTRALCGPTFESRRVTVHG